MPSPFKRIWGMDEWCHRDAAAAAFGDTQMKATEGWRGNLHPILSVCLMSPWSAMAHMVRTMMMRERERERERRWGEQLDLMVKWLDISLHCVCMHVYVCVCACVCVLSPLFSCLGETHKTHTQAFIRLSNSDVEFICCRLLHMWYYFFFPLRLLSFLIPCLPNKPSRIRPGNMQWNTQFTESGRLSQGITLAWCENKCVRSVKQSVCAAQAAPIHDR